MIQVIGIGLEGWRGLSETARELIDQATVLVGSSRHLSYIASEAAKRIVLGNIAETLSKVRSEAAQGQRIAILVSGDPLYFGLGRLLLNEFPAEELAFHPHISSIQLAFNRIKIPWQDACVISAHGRSLEELGTVLQQGKDKIAILTDGVNTPGAIAQFYRSLDLPTPYQFWVCEDLGGETEKVQCFNPLELNTTFSPLNVLVLIRQDASYTPLSLESLPLLGLPDSSFASFRDRPGLMTKREIRIMILAQLALQPGQIIWDIGAGTGSVSIEIARLCPTSHIYAIEKTAVGFSLIQQNSDRFFTPNITPLCGSAPQALENLPNPDRIFIGGSGGYLSEILDICQSKLTPSGVIVFALATLEHQHLALNWLQQHNWDYSLLNLQISRSTPIAQLTRFSPLNPVTLVTASRSIP